MEPLYVDWASLKSFVTSRGLSIQWVVINNTYRLRAMDGFFSLDASIEINGNSDQIDFETNFKDAGNLSPRSQVITQFERPDLVLKLAKTKVDIVAHQGIVNMKVPGTFGAPGEGRLVDGGYGILDSFDPDDYVLIYLSDTDRQLAAVYGAAANLGRSMTDTEMIAQGDYPEYPKIGSYTDDALPAENRGWYFWPIITHDTTLGEVEFEPIGGYGFIPAGFYLTVEINRPNVATGTIRAGIFWGTKA